MDRSEKPSVGEKAHGGSYAEHDEVRPDREAHGDHRAHPDRYVRHDREPQSGRKERACTFHIGSGDGEDDSERGSGKVSLKLNLEALDESQLGRAALLLAATKDVEDEGFLKDELQRIGWRSVATEVGGLAGDIPRKMTRAVVGASLNAGVVEKRPHEMHALMHATLEAMNAFMPTSMLEASIGAKIGIVRNRHWIAVAILGDTAFHAVAHHERCGMGVMHI